MPNPTALGVKHDAEGDFNIEILDTSNSCPLLTDSIDGVRDVNFDIMPVVLHFKQCRIM